MANVKNAGIRELILDRCLQERRGYTIEQLLERVNRALIFEGLRPVTSGNTIRNDLDTIANRWKQALIQERKGKALCFSYRDPSFSIFNSQLTHSELKHLHSALLTIKYLDAYQGSLIYTELNERLKEILKVDHFQVPILLYDNVPSDKELYHFRTLYDCIRYRQPVRIEHTNQVNEETKLLTVHPYFMRQHRKKWHLVGHNHHNSSALSLPLEVIKSVERDHETDFIERKPFDIDSYYFALFEKGEK